VLRWLISGFLVGAGNHEWLSGYIDVARRYGLRAGLCFNDISRALQITDELRGLDFVIAPISATGFRMTPDQSTCEAIILRGNHPSTEGRPDSAPRVPQHL
jgi:hypothetical protein